MKNKELIPKVEILERQNYALCEDNKELIKQSPYSKNLYLKYVETPKIEMKEYKSNEYWQDKIKAKIEEYENKIKKIRNKKLINEPEDTIVITRYAHYIEFGQSLLEKE